MMLVHKFDPACTAISVEWANKQKPELMTINTDNLFLQGQTVYLDRVRHWMQDLAWPPIGVVEWQGTHYIRDGLHRCFAALLLRKQYILAHVLKADPSQAQPQGQAPGELVELAQVDDDDGQELAGEPPGRPGPGLRPSPIAGEATR